MAKRTKDPLVQASKGAKAKAPTAGGSTEDAFARYRAKGGEASSISELAEHGHELAERAKQASEHAGTQQDGPSHKDAARAHARAAEALHGVGDSKAAAAHEKLSELHHGEAVKHGASAPKAKPSHAETMEGLQAKRAGIAAKTASAKEKTAASKARTAGMHEELGKVNAAKSAADEHNEGLKKKIGGLEHEVKKTEGAARKQEAANRKALRSSGEDDKHVPDHKLIGGAKEPNKTIVLAKLVEDREVVKPGQPDIGIKPTFRQIHRPVAMVWHSNGTAEDTAKAQKYAATEGYKVLHYPTNESDPLARAKGDVEKDHRAEKVREFASQRTGRDAGGKSYAEDPKPGQEKHASAQAAPGPKTEAARAAQAKAKAERDEAEKSGDPKRIGAARKAHSEATAAAAEAHKEEEGAQPKKPRAARASKDPLVQASKGRRTRARAPREAGDAAAGAHVRANMAEGASKLAQNKALMGGGSEGARGVSDRRIRSLMANGEDKRNTPAFRDAVHERRLLDNEGHMKARETSDRRLQHLTSLGEDKKNTPAFRDAQHEQRENSRHEFHDRLQKEADRAPEARNAGVAGAKERLAASRARVAGLGKPPTAEATHAAETQARQAGLATSHGEAFGKLHGAYSALAQHHEISARTATDAATKASHANLAAHYGNTRDFVAPNRANAGDRLKDSNASEREHAGHAEAHRFAAKGAGHPSIAALHNNLAAHHDELHAHHVANRHGIGLQDARKAVKDASESMRKGGIRSRGEAHNFRTGKRGGWYFVNQHGVKVYAGKGHR